MEKSVISLIGFILLPVLLFSQGLIINTANRNIRSLDGNWNYIVDPYETGFYNFHAKPYEEDNPKSTAAFYNNFHTKDKAALVEYDFDKSPSLKIPGDWNTQRAELFYYEGTIWFKRLFDYNLATGKRLFVYFGAANYKADIYLNGIKLGTHTGGFTPFNFEITGIVKPADNYLVVKVDNKRVKEGVPALSTDWWNYGGVTRSVLLIEEPTCFIRDYSLQLKKGSNNILTGYLQMDKVSAAGNVVVKIPELKIEQPVAYDINGYGRFEIIKNNLQYWSPEQPKLYDVIFKTDWQTIKDEIGFRTIETKGADILLNGNPVFLKGISIHEDYYGRRAHSQADAVAILSLAKELGCNFVRLAHYPHNEHMVKQADKMGLMVWEEIPVYWTIDFGNKAAYGNASNQLTEVITRDKNRASVIIWSMANETPVSSIRNKFISSLAQHARSLDSSRLISAALLTRSEKGINIVDDTLGAVTDVVAFNQYRGWYGGDLETAPEAQWVCPYNKPIIISEFGGGAVQGRRGDKTERWTEEHQAYLYKQNILMLEKIRNIRGMSPWILMDFRSPRRLLPGVQDGFNRKGLVSDKRIKKQAFFVLCNYYKGK